MQLSSFGNKYLQDNEPWKLIKTDAEKVKEIMYFSTQIVGMISYVSKPFLPKTAT
jgi:methionyl-tRNA synthetase